MRTQFALAAGAGGVGVPVALELCVVGGKQVCSRSTELTLIFAARCGALPIHSMSATVGSRGGCLRDTLVGVCSEVTSVLLAGTRKGEEAVVCIEDATGTSVDVNALPAAQESRMA